MTCKSQDLSRLERGRTRLVVFIPGEPHATYQVRENPRRPGQWGYESNWDNRFTYNFGSLDYAQRWLNGFMQRTGWRDGRMQRLNYRAFVVTEAEARTWRNDFEGLYRERRAAR